MIEITKGYKQTELGVIPEDWEIISYGEAFDFLSTATYSRADLSDNDDVFYVHYGDIHTTWNYFLDFKKNTLPTIEKVKVKNYSFIKDGDLIMADASEDYNGIGKSVEVKNITTNKAISGLHTFLLRGKEGIFVDGFKGYIHSNRIVKTSMDRLATGLKVYGVSKTNLKTILIPRPTLPEQTAIATVLSDTDALIENLEKLIAKKKAIKQGAMQQLLTGKKRLPGFSGEWEVKKLGEIGKFKGGNGFPVKYQGRINGEYPFYKVSDMNNDGNQTFMRDSNNWIDESIRKVIGDNVFPKHSIVFAKIGAAIFLERKKILSRKSCIDNNMMGFIFDENQNDYRFLHYIFINIQLGKLVSTTALPFLNGKEIAELNFAFPKMEEQTAIATVLSDMDAEIESLEQKRDKYTMLKQGMMQELLTGKIRLLNIGTNAKPKAQEKIIVEKSESQNKKHNWEINEAVVISVLTNKFGTKEYPLGRKRYTKLSYLLHRNKEKKAEGYLKKAAGPYNPATRYKGPEDIAVKNGYIKTHSKNTYSGFIADNNIEKAMIYFIKWYGQEALQWLEQFRYIETDKLELLATVDMAVQELLQSNQAISVENVKAIIQGNDEWQAKLERPIFSDKNIDAAIKEIQDLFKA